MNKKNEFINAGFAVIGEDNQPNKLLEFIKENYPSIIQGNEIKLNELKAVLGFPVDEKVNGYGLNFVGRNVARAKYASETDKELSVNTALSKDFDTTQNLVLKGDNLDSLKILKSHYSDKIKCIYIDPPYNTDKDAFVYLDKFDKEEAEVLGLANLSETDMDRLKFSFGSTKSHNGWLSFMYPRLLLARDLLSKDGVIFISIDDNEQANLKLLCDEVFGEKNFVGAIKRRAARKTTFLSGTMSDLCDYVLVYSKKRLSEPLSVENVSDKTRPVFNAGNSNSEMKISINTESRCKDGVYKANKYKAKTIEFELLNDIEIKDGKTQNEAIIIGPFRVKQELLDKTVYFTQNFSLRRHLLPEEMETAKLMSDLLDDNKCYNENGSEELKNLLGVRDVFSNPKPVSLIKYLIKSCQSLTDKEEMIVLDFFAGSGTTGQAVMEMNSDGNNRKFILCQKEEKIEQNEHKSAYNFCIDNKLPPLISSITIERLKRAGGKIAKEIEAENAKTGLFDENKKQIPDMGYKVFDSVEAPKLKVDEETKQISIIENEIDALSRIYNMVFSVGLDQPTTLPECVVEDCIYKIDHHFYITNSEKATSDDIANAIKNGRVFIDGWTASINTTLQHFKQDVKVIF